MKKLTHILLSTFLLATAFSSCNNYHSISTVTKVSQLKGNPFMYNISKSVLKTIAAHATAVGAKGSGKVNLITPVAEVFSVDQMGGLKELLAKTYKIPAKRMGADFDKLVTFKDVISFVAKFGKGFNFYSSNTSL